MFARRGGGDPPLDPPSHTPPPPFKILGQIFLQAFGQSKLFSGDFRDNSFRPKLFFGAFGASKNSAPPEGGCEGWNPPPSPTAPWAEPWLRVQLGNSPGAKPWGKATQTEVPPAAPAPSPCHCRLGHGLGVWGAVPELCERDAVLRSPLPVPRPRPPPPPPTRRPLPLTGSQCSPPPPPPRAAVEGEGLRRGAQKRLGRRLEEVAKAVRGSYCRLHMPLKLALAVRGTVVDIGMKYGKSTTHKIRQNTTHQIR